MTERDTRQPRHDDNELRIFGLGLALALIIYELFVLATG